jgi:drug/metabolite transporter (DMT)-like permease
MHGAFGAMIVATAAIGVLTVMDGLIKHVSAELATPQIVFLRYVAGVTFAGIAFVIAGTRRPAIEAVRAHAFRAVAVAITATTFFYALAVLPFAVAIALTFTAPFFIALLAALTLGETPGRGVWGAIAVGFAGVLVVLSGELHATAQATWLGIGAALVAALSYAVVMVMLKSRTAVDPIPTIVLLQNVLAGAFMAPLAAWTWTPPSGAALAWLVLIGGLGTIGHFGMAWAYGRAEASRLGVVEYTAFIWAALLGFIFFAEVPKVATIAGATLIIAGATLVMRRRP